MSLFYFFDGDGTDRAGLGGGYIPRRRRPQPPAHPDGLHSTGSKTDRTRCKADHARHDTHAQALDTLHRSAPDTRQAVPCRLYRRRVLDGVERVRNLADTDAHKPPCIKSHFCDVLLLAQRFYPLQSHTSVIL